MFANLSRPITEKFNDLIPVIGEYNSKRNSGTNDTSLYNMIKSDHSGLIDYIDFAIDSINNISPVDDGFKKSVLNYLNNCKLIFDNDYGEIIAILDKELEEEEIKKYSELKIKIVQKLQMAEIELKSASDVYIYKYKIEI